jgi:hypothetical protein
MSKLLSPSMIETLRREYAKVERIDPSSGNYKNLIAKLDKTTPEILQQLADSQIKFVSGLARNRVRTPAARMEEDASPSSVHADLLSQLNNEVLALPFLSDEMSYKRAIRRLLIAKPVIPAAQVEQFVRRYLTANPYNKYRAAKRAASNPMQATPESQQPNRMHAPVREAEDEDADMGDEDKDPRDIEKREPEDLDLDWISKFDLGEIKEAIQKIIDHLSETEDDEQIDLLRNDIRILDNLHGALGKKDSQEVKKHWKIAKSEGSAEHLHDEFNRRMDDALESKSMREGYVVEEERNTYNSKAKWDKAARKFRVKATGKSETAYCKDTGAMMGRWSGEKGWLETC